MREMDWIGLDCDIEAPEGEEVVQIIQNCGDYWIHLLRARKQPKRNSANTLPNCMKLCHNKKAQRAF